MCRTGLAWAALILTSTIRCGVSAQIQNVTLQNTNSRLLYIPKLCTTGGDCKGGWSVVDLPGSSNGSVTTTKGPDIQTGDILPQIFLTFRASALFVKTSEVSNATANLTVSSLPSGQLESRIFAPSRDFWALEDLNESQNSTIAITFFDEEAQNTGSVTRLDIDFIKISVTNASATSSFLPAQTVPTSIFQPSFVPAMTSPSPTNSDMSQNRLPIGAIVGGTVAGFVTVLLAVSLIAFFLWRHHRRRCEEQRRKETNAQLAVRQIMQPVASAPQLPPLRI